MRLALTHRSFLHNNGGADRESNERLEYLGDSVLGLVCSEWLYRNRPNEHEGQLTKTKSLLVSKAILSRRALAMGLGRFVLLSNSEVESGGRQRLSILADAFEAVIGAIYLDQGLDAAREFITAWLLNEANGIIADKRHTNYKSLLQEYVQSTFHTHPVYRIRSETGPDHQKVFTVDVLVGNRNLGEGRGQNKKEAEQDAARDALDRVAAKSAPRRGGARGERDRDRSGRGSRGRGAERVPGEHGERPERDERLDRAERPRPARGAGRKPGGEPQATREAEPGRRRGERAPSRERGRRAAAHATEEQRPPVREKEKAAPAAATGEEGSGSNRRGERRGPKRERRRPAGRRAEEVTETAPGEPKPAAESEERKPDLQPEESHPASALRKSAEEMVYGRAGKRATRGLHSEAARAELEAATPPEEPGRAVAESPISTPQRHGRLALDAERFAPESGAPEVEIVSVSGSTPAGAPSDRYRAAESGGFEQKSAADRRKREETSADPDESSEP